MLNFKDASLLSVLQTQVRNINVRVMETPLTDITYPSLLPVNQNYADWQPDTAAITMGAGVGEAKWISGYAKDVPFVETTASVSAIPFAVFAVGYETNYEELGMAANAGMNISDVKARIGRRKAEEFIQARTLTGDVDKGWTGLLNKAGITPTVAATKAAGGTFWILNSGVLNATAAEIARDLMNLILGPVVSASQVRPIVADTVALPSLAYRALASTFTDVLNGGISYLEYIRRQIAGAVPGTNFQIVEIPELATAATAGTPGGGRAIGYRRSLDILELPMPFAFRYLEQYKDAPFGWMTPGWARIGQVTVWEPRGFRYMDGITPVPA